MSLFEPLRIQITVLPTIVSFIISNPATDSAPAGYKIMASSLYISSIVFATNPSWTRCTSNFSYLRISLVIKYVRRECCQFFSLKLRRQRSQVCLRQQAVRASENCTLKASLMAQILLLGHLGPSVKDSSPILKPILHLQHRWKHN